MIRSILYITVAIAFLFSCTPGSDDSKIQNDSALNDGIWRGTISGERAVVPFLFEVQTQQDSSVEVFLINGKERFPITDVIVDKDSVHISVAIFDAALHAKVSGNTLSGVYVKNYLPDYKLPFQAVYGDSLRFGAVSEPPSADFNGRWETDFIEEDTATKEISVSKALGIFEQRGNYVTGTFATPSGDYRFLEGVVDGSILKLSAFDGTHLYLFEGTMNSKGEIDGDFWSGKSFHQKWTAIKNDNFTLPDPYSLTFMKPGQTEFNISFPDVDGNIVSLQDEQFKDKVVVIQILGTWCPNCMDESQFLATWYDNNKNRGAEIIGLAFERKANPEYASERVKTMKGKLGIRYPVLIAGTTSAESRSEALPMLEKVISFPTTIILDKNHKVRKIHTGFSGPGTGVLYEEYVEDFHIFMDKLLAE